MADEAEAKGNVPFAAGNNTVAINQPPPTDDVLDSNRSAAQKTVDWSSVHAQLKAIHFGVRRLCDDTAFSAAALKKGPRNEALNSGVVAPLPRVREKKSSSSLSSLNLWPKTCAKLTAHPTTRAYLEQPDFVDIMKDPKNWSLGAKDRRVMHALDVLLTGKIGGFLDIPDDVYSRYESVLEKAKAEQEASRAIYIPTLSSWSRVCTKLKTDQTTEAYLEQPDFVKMMREVLLNPFNFQHHLNDERVIQAFDVLFSRMPPPDTKEVLEARRRKREAETPTSTGVEPVKGKVPERMEISEEEREARQRRKAEAQKENEAGTARQEQFYFETAHQHYTKAIELDDEDISYLTNRAALYLDMGKYEECIKDCDRAVERGEELKLDRKMIARALARKATAKRNRIFSIIFGVSEVLSEL